MEEISRDELISKYLAGEARPEEAMELEDWKEQSLENMAYYLECEKLFFASQTFKTITDEQVKAALDTVKSQLDYTEKRTPVFKIGNVFKIAAAIALLAVAAVIINYYRQQAGNGLTTYTAQATEKMVRLGDNSSVTLSPNSGITIDEEYGKTNRLVKLNGSAYFQVEHSEEKPMIVDAGHVYIKDIGTKFRITTSYNKDTINVMVDEGVVLLYDSAGVEITLNAGHSAAYIKSLKKIAEQPQATAAISFAFKHQLLKDVVVKLSAAFNTPVTLEDESIGNCRLTAEFAGEELETVLDIITETLGLTYTKTGNGYSIKGSRCNN